MKAVKARFDGREIILPDDVGDLAPCEVIVIFPMADVAAADRRDWERAQEEAFARAWDNPEDEVYHTL